MKIKFKANCRKRSAFTLIEVMIVLTVIAALLSIAVPIGINSVYQARATNYITIVREIFMAESVYYMDNSETTDLNSLCGLYIPSNWVNEQSASLTNWQFPKINSVAFTVEIDQPNIAKAFVSMFENTSNSSATLEEGDSEDVRIFFEF